MECLREDPRVCIQLQTHFGRCAHAFSYRLDRLEYFKLPVSRTTVPDYYDVVTEPMSWSIIEQRLIKHEYWTLQKFKVSF